MRFALKTTRRGGRRGSAQAKPVWLPSSEGTADTLKPKPTRSSPSASHKSGLVAVIWAAIYNIK